MTFDPSRAKSLFLAALELTQAERPAFLDRECGENSDLRQRVDALLRANEGLPPKAQEAYNPDDPTKIPQQKASTRTVAESTHLHIPHEAHSVAPTKVGLGDTIANRYTLIEMIGEGGMGSVYRANQTEPIKRHVALKLIKTGMDSKAVLARFDAERQALALMDHPNIARIYDGGVTPAAQPFFVMELVNGVPLTTYCDSKRLTVNARLQLFVQVCHAVQHAHQKGVIHRDLKPGNVLVTEVDGRPTTKVIDFGVAKATEQKLTDASYMDTGAIVGTPAYMSPEQADPSWMDIDTRTDIYGLGVMLYELLTGSPPIDSKQFQRGAILEMLRMVREVEPPRPSTKLGTDNALSNIAAKRSIDPGKLPKLLRGELDWVVMKALEKDRNRRYDTANGFALDIQRYLADEVVEARPPSKAYQVKKFLRRNRTLAIATSLVATSFSAGLAGTTWGQIKAERQASELRIEQAKTRDAQARAELSLVHSFLRPLGYTDLPADAELIVFDELARQEDDRIKMLFLEEALSNGDRALRIARRADRVVQASVGLSPKRRAAALELTSAKQRDATADPQVRLCACWLAIELGSDDLPALQEGFDVLLTRKSLDWKSFTERMSARLSGSNTTIFVNAQVALINRGADVHDLRVAGIRLAEISQKLDPATALRGFEALLEAFSKDKDLDALWEIPKALQLIEELRAAEKALVPLAASLDQAMAVKKYDELLTTLSKTSKGEHARASGFGLAALTPWIDSSLAAERYKTLITILDNTVHQEDKDQPKRIGGTIWDIDQVVQAAGTALIALVPKLDSEAVGSGLDSLLSLLRFNDIKILREVSTVLTVLIPRLDPAINQSKLIKVSNALMQNASRTNDELTTRAAAEGLVALAPLLEPEVAQANLASTVDNIASNLDVAGEVSGTRAAGAGLAVLAPKLPPAVAKAKLAALVNALLAILSKTNQAFERQAAAEALTTLAPILDSTTASLGFNAVLATLAEASDEPTKRVSGVALAALARRLDSLTAGQSFDTLIVVQRKTTDPAQQRAVGSGLEALVTRLELERVTRAADSIEELGRSLEGTTSVDFLCDPLVALWSRLPVQERSERLHRMVRRVVDFKRQGFTVVSNVRNVADDSPSGLIRCIGLIDSVPFLIDLLHEPSCVGHFQSAVLARLEQLAFPSMIPAEGIAGLGAAISAPFVWPILEASTQDHLRQKLRFRTVTDAVNWIVEHHPEIDLNRPYEK